MIKISKNKIYISFNVFIFQLIYRLIYNLFKEIYINFSKFNFSFRNLASNDFLILAYHQVEDICNNKLNASDKYIKVTCKDFRNQMLELKKTHEIIFVSDIYNKKIKNFKINNKPIACVTFDDGHISYLKNALPILKELNIKSTVYLISEIFMENKKPNEWWLYLWEYSMNVKSLNLLFFNKYLSININNLIKKNFFRIVYFKSLSYLYERISIRKQSKIDKVINTYQINFSNNYINKSNIKNLDNKALIKIGSHSQTHRHLSKLSNKQLKNEIINSKNDLEKILKIKIKDFCYPYGRERDIGKNVFDEVSKYYRSSVLSETKLPQYLGNNLEHIFLPRISINGNYSLRIFKNILKNHKYKLLKKFR